MVPNTYQATIRFANYAPSPSGLYFGPNVGSSTIIDALETTVLARYIVTIHGKFTDPAP
jgi:hypothetical protein